MSCVLYWRARHLETFKVPDVQFLPISFVRRRRHLLVPRAPDALLAIGLCPILIYMKYY